MDKTSTLLPPIKAESIPVSKPTPPSSETSLAKQDQPDTAKTHTVDIPPPPFINSINELRSLSTALSTFLIQYDELHNHTNSIMSAIDSKLPNHLLYTANSELSSQTPLIESTCDHAITAVPDTTSSERNPNGNVSNCERSHETVTLMKEPEETDTLMEHEKTDVSEEPEETDTAIETEGNPVPDTTSSKRNPNGNVGNRERGHETVTLMKEPEVTDTLVEHDKTDVSEEPEETDTSIETEGNLVPDTTRSERNPNGNVSSYERSHETLTLMKEPEETDSLMEHEKTDVSEEPEETDTSIGTEGTNISKELKETADSKKAEEIDISKKPAVTELERYCEKMCGRDIRKYATTHISDMNKLREEIPKALKFAEDPAKLVLNSIGRFFLQHSPAFLKDARMVAGRLAAVVTLECFVMVSNDDIEIAKEDKEHAAKAAVDWRKRMLSERKLGRKTEEIDARGLLLLISGFGVPDVFKNDDIWDLISVCNVKEISLALRRSIFLIRKIPEVINWMVKGNMEVEAANIAYSFGLEDKCHPETILTTFLHNTIKNRKHGSSTRVREATMKQLSDLKSLRKCLESHKIDPANLLPNFKLNQKIKHLEEEVKKFDIQEKQTQKRKAKEAAKNLPHQHEPKRRRPDDMPHQQKAGDHFQPTVPSSIYGGSYSNRVSYGWHEEAALVNRYLGQPYPPIQVQGQRYHSQPSSFPGMVGSGSSGFSGRGGAASDLYGFADKVVTDGASGSGSGTMRSSYLY